MKPHIYFITTKNCNLTCDHCYLSCGPGLVDTTISDEDFSRVISNLLKTSLELTLSGGEIYSVKKRLYNFLEIIKGENRARKTKRQNAVEICLQTNAFWATSEEKIKKELDYLDKLKIKVEFDIPSDDYFHHEEGIRLDILKKYVKRNNLEESIRFRGQKSKTKNVAPIGRGKDINPKGFFDWKGCRHALSNYHVTVHPDGSCFMCCLGIFKLEGNVIEEPLTKIIARSKRNPRLNILNEKGIRALAAYDKHPRGEIKKLVDQYGKCGMCFKLCQDDFYE